MVEAWWRQGEAWWRQGSERILGAVAEAGLCHMKHRDQ